MRFKVVAGVDEPLSSMTAHRKVEGIERLRLLDRQAIPGRSFHVAAHVVSADYRPQESSGFTDPESHTFDEVNVLLPGDDGLRYRYEIDEEVHFVEGPCTVFIAAGTMHRMEPVEGSGTFLCIQLDTNGR